MPGEVKNRVASSGGGRQGEAREVRTEERARACVHVCTCMYVTRRVSLARVRLWVLLCVSRGTLRVRVWRHTRWDCCHVSSPSRDEQQKREGKCEHFPPFANFPFLYSHRFTTLKILPPSLKYLSSYKQISFLGNTRKNFPQSKCYVIFITRRFSHFAHSTPATGRSLEFIQLFPEDYRTSRKECSTFLKLILLVPTIDN